MIVEMRLCRKVRAYIIHLLVVAKQLAQGLLLRIRDLLVHRARLTAATSRARVTVKAAIHLALPLPAEIGPAA